MLTFAPRHTVGSFLLLVMCSTLFHPVENAALQTTGGENTLYDVTGIGGRPLMVKAYPAVENYQSDLFEVYAEPYTYDLRAQVAIAVLVGEEESEVKGEIMFIQQHPPIGPVLIRGNITGLPPGRHGFHIHQSGDLRQGCGKLGGHFNPYLLPHGAPTDPLRHAGDLGNVDAGDDGVAQIRIVDALTSLSGGPRGVVGRAVVVTTDADDLGRGGVADSVVDGQSGRALACGVIAYVR
uniref:superoxide dismutase n=1 Tax=Chrysomela lapponica TaxID=153811 RepID=A0A0S2A4A1_CHRLA|nr:putative copper/zinc superoxide dismutase [Chrysomela lapponica]ALN12444.1 putative copper/zinc superoxide dismutase [Chrysomela lapponica]